jgi:hypothetical protein
VRGYARGLRGIRYWIAGAGRDSDASSLRQAHQPPPSRSGGPIIRHQYSTPRVCSGSAHLPTMIMHTLAASALGRPGIDSTEVFPVGGDGADAALAPFVLARVLEASTTQGQGRTLRTKIGGEEAQERSRRNWGRRTSRRLRLWLWLWLWLWIRLRFGLGVGLGRRRSGWAAAWTLALWGTAAATGRATSLGDAIGSWTDCQQINSGAEADGNLPIFRTSRLDQARKGSCNLSAQPKRSKSGVVAQTLCGRWKGSKESFRNGRADVNKQMRALTELGTTKTKLSGAGAPGALAARELHAPP